MCFQGMSRDAEKPEEWYYPHSEHQAYLEAYAALHDIDSVASYNTRVEKVDEVENGWRVWSKTFNTTRDADSTTVTITYSVITTHQRHQTSQVSPSGRRNGQTDSPTLSASDEARTGKVAAMSWLLALDHLDQIWREKSASTQITST
jgi:hypothetical protein